MNPDLQRGTAWNSTSTGAVCNRSSDELDRHRGHTDHKGVLREPFVARQNTLNTGRSLLNSDLRRKVQSKVVLPLLDVGLFDV